MLVLAFGVFAIFTFSDVFRIDHRGLRGAVSFLEEAEDSDRLPVNG